MGGTPVTSPRSLLGGTPVLDGGYPMVGNPQPGQDGVPSTRSGPRWGVTPLWGTPYPGEDGVHPPGLVSMGYPPARSGCCTPWPGQDVVPPLARDGVPPRIGYAWTGYVAGGTLLRFPTGELPCYQKCFNGMEFLP